MRVLTIGEAIDTLLVIESLIRLAARTAASRMAEPGAADRISRALAGISAFDPADGSAEYAIARGNFYAAITGVAGNLELSRIVPTVQLHLIRVQFRAILRSADESRYDDYRRIAKAVLAGQAGAAETAVAKHLKNAQDGFWNGQTPPMGYRTYEAERREGKSKRKLEVDEDEAFIVRLIFDLYLIGPAGSPALGITKLAQWLNENGYKLRGKKFHVSNVQLILRNTAYIGVAFYNKRDSKTGEQRPEEQWIPIPVPPLIPTEDFEAVQARLVDRRPTARAARVTTTNNLLIGITVCGCAGDGCGGGMTTSTGKSGQYKYYACSNRARAGPSICQGRRMPMDKLDDIVLDALEERLLTPERLRDLLSSWLDHSNHAEESRREKLRQLRTRKTSLGAGLDRLLDLVAEGHLTASDPRFAKKHADQKAQLVQVEADIVLLERQLANSEKRITPELIERFAILMRERLRDSDPALRQYYIRSIVGRIEVGNQEIRILGTTKALEHAVGRLGAKPHFPVPIIEREWCARQDSNLRPPA